MAMHLEFVVPGPPRSNQGSKKNLITWRGVIDVDNMSKPILDAMQNFIYKNDRQIRQAEITHVKIGAAFSITGVSKILLNAIQAGSQFVYVRIEDPVDPFPLPK